MLQVDEYREAMQRASIKEERMTSSAVPTWGLFSLHRDWHLGKD